MGWTLWLLWREPAILLQIPFHRSSSSCKLISMSFPEQLSYLSAQIMPRFLYLPILMHVPISPISPMKYTHFQNINARHTQAQVWPTLYLSVQTNNFLLMRKAIVIHLSVDLLFLSFFCDSPTCWNNWNPSLVIHTHPCSLYLSSQIENLCQEEHWIHNIATLSSKYYNNKFLM